MSFTSIKKIFSILNKHLLLQLSLLSIFTLLISFLELVGISFLASFVLFLSDIDKFLLSLPNTDLTNNIIKLDDSSKIMLFLVLITIVFSIKNLLIFVFTVFFNKTRVKINLYVSKAVLFKYLNSSYIFFLSKKMSQIVNDIREETSRFTGIIFSYINVLKEALLILFLLIGIIAINWKVTLGVSLILFVISYLIILLLKKKLIKLGQEQTYYSTRLFKNLYETFSGLKFIKVRFLEEHFFKKVAKTHESVFDVSFKQSIFVVIPRLMLELIAVIGLCLTIYFFLEINYSFNEIIPMITFLSLAIIRMVPAISGLNNNINNILSHSIAIDIITNLIDANKINKNFKQEDLNSNFEINTLEIKNVSFKYPSNVENVLNNINFKLKKNDILGVIGKSGCGKTTLVDIILGLLKPNYGNILINEKNIEEYNNLNLSYVPQSINVLDDNLYSNIAYGINEKKINKEEVKKLISLMELSNSQNNLNNNIGESGLNISGGQKQRIGLARGVYNNPSLIVLDEPTSELDYETEEKIMQSLFNQSNSKILIIVAHRINTLNICNKLLILDKGESLDFGAKDEIINRHKYLEKYFQK